MPSSSASYTPLHNESLPLLTRLKLFVISKRALPLLVLIPLLGLVFSLLPPSPSLASDDPSSPSYYSPGSSIGSPWLPSPFSNSSSWHLGGSKGPSSSEGGKNGGGKGVGGYAQEGKVDEEGKGVNHRYGMNLHDAFIHVSHHSEQGKFTGKETRWMRGVPGYSMFENVYVQNGQMVAITSDPDSLPPLTKFLSDMSRGTPENSFPVADETRWLVISPEKAVEMWGEHRAARLPGATIFINDGPGPEGYLAHYFHFAAEIFSGAIRVLSAAPELLKAGSAMWMDFPRRVILAKGQDWRDEPGLNAWFMSTLFPMMAVEDSLQWNDRTLSGNLYMFDEIVIIDRWASHRHNPTTGQWNKMNADVFREVKAPKDWWAPVRESMMLSLGIENIHVKDRPTVIYISRQLASKRRLTDASHAALVSALTALDTSGAIEFHAPSMEKLSKREQMALVTKADVILGVHGNGLTNEIWMKPGGAVIEIFDVGGFSRDYQLLTEPLDHQYISVWNDKIYDWEADVPGFKLSDNFAGVNFTVSAELIVDTITGLFANGTVNHNRRWEGGDAINDADVDVL